MNSQARSDRAMQFRKAIEALVDGIPYRHALFYNYPGGLRFELSNGGQPLDQVLTALRKATVICNDIFGSEGMVLVHLQKYLPSNRYQLRSVLRELDLAGISIPPERNIWLIHEPDPDWDGYWANVAFELPVSKLQNLLWCALATDFAELRPNPHCQVYLIDWHRKVIVHPYDDRGMDVIGNTIALQPLYDRYGAWLLDYDREAMFQTFGS